MSSIHCKVLGVRDTAKGFRVAHVQVGQFFGDVPADDGIVAPGSAFLETRLRVRMGRLEIGLKAYPAEVGGVQS